MQGLLPILAKKERTNYTSNTKGGKSERNNYNVKS